MLLGKLESSSIVLLISNIFTIILAIIFQWNIGVVLWAYWAESVIIGLFIVIKQVFYNQDKTANNMMGALFFCFHYGFFHFVYLIFLSVFSFIIFNMSITDIFDILVMVGILFGSHLFSFIKNINTDPASNLFGDPYKRIVPMHITIIGIGFIGGIFGAENFNTTILILFMGLKTIIDLLSHINKHRLTD